VEFVLALTEHNVVAQLKNLRLHPNPVGGRRSWVYQLSPGAVIAYNEGSLPPFGYVITVWFRKMPIAEAKCFRFSSPTEKRVCLPRRQRREKRRQHFRGAFRLRGNG
jgi:hypothetical protein